MASYGVTSGLRGPGAGAAAYKKASLVAAVFTAVLCGCVGAESIPPSGQGTSRASLPAAVLGIDWGRAASVERPVNYTATQPPSDNPTHPILRIPGQAYIVDLTPLPAGGLVAVGYSPPKWTAAAWTSPDGSTWVLHQIDPSEFSFAVAVATGADGNLVAVGRSGSLPVAWTTADGVTWQRQSVPTVGHDGVAERMTTVVATDTGYLAGGSSGPELFERHARFWTSPDGVTWEPVPDDDVAFANAEVRSIARFGDGFVAVGVVGSVQDHTGAVSWTSPDGVHWTRVDDPAFTGGTAVSVTSAPFGGLVAVGSDLDRHDAVAWVSPDGRKWTRAPNEASREYSGGFVWMTDVTVVGDQVLAVGDYQGLQRGTATAWVSHDGLTWERAHSAPVQEGAEFYAVIANGPGAIVVGAFGAPDSYVPEVWLSPAR
jgi:hypothetical protein